MAEPWFVWTPVDEAPESPDRARRTRADLVDAAAGQFARRGYHAASLRDVVADAGVTKGALYFHFDSKVDLAQAVTEAASEAWRTVVTVIAARGLDPLQEMLLQSDVALVRFDHDVVFRAALRVTSESADLAGIQAAWRIRWEQRTIDLLERALAEGLLRPGTDPATTGRGVVALQWGHHALGASLPGAPGSWERMGESWESMLGALADPSWLRDWHASGWRDRPRPSSTETAPGAQPVVPSTVDGVVGRVTEA